MIRVRLTWLSASLVLCAGCQLWQPGAKDSQPERFPASGDEEANPRWNISSGWNLGRAKPKAPATPAPPAASDEEWWAVRCITLRGPNRFKYAQQYADGLKKVPGLDSKLVQIVQDDDGVNLYYGRYRQVYDPRAQTDRFEPDPLPALNLIRELSSGPENWPFRLATMEALPIAEPGDPRWDLSRAKGYWSLHVGVFYNSEGMRQRRKAAVEYCKLLRGQGEEAYYHHGPAQSSVYVSVYPEQAIRTVQRPDPLTGIPTVVNKIVDERMLAAQRRFPISLHNGHILYEVVRDPATGAVKDRIPTPSFPVKIPQADAGLRGLE